MLYSLALALMSLPLGAFGRRWSGGLLSDWLHFDIGTQGGRAVWGACLACVAALAGAPWWLALALGAGFPIGSAIRGNSPGMGVTGLADVGWLTLHGAAVVALPAAVAFAAIGSPLAVWPLLLAGALCAPCYIVTHQWPLTAPWLGCDAAGPRDKRTATAEMLWGAVLALGVAGTLDVGGVAPVALLAFAGINLVCVVVAYAVLRVVLR